MTDFERDLRAMMRNRTKIDLEGALPATKSLVRRARVQRAGPVAVSAMLLLALVIGGTAASRSLFEDRPCPTRACLLRNRARSSFSGRLDS